jgi:Domain of unknown function (DUF4184)
VPFTLAHPAAILPLRRIRLLRTAPLIIGALIPDTPYYLPVSFARAAVGAHRIPDTHSLAGSLSTCLILGYLALGGVFALQQPLTALLSARARALCLGALAPFRRRPLEWLLAAVAIVLGVWTHLLWDSFTHLDGWMVHRVAALRAPVIIGPYQGTVCHLLQYLSSALGLAVMALWYRRLATPAAAGARADGARLPLGPVLLLLAGAAILIGSVQATTYFGHSPNLYRTLNLFLTRSLAWFALLYLVAGAIVVRQHALERTVPPIGR